MEKMFYTLHDFMLHAESVTYIIMGISLFSILGFYLFLTERDDED